MSVAGSLFRVSTAGLALAIALLLTAIGCERKVGDQKAAAHSVVQRSAGPATTAKDENSMYKKPTDAELRQRLSPLEYEVTQHDATEPPFNNRYWDHHDEGLYVDVTTGEPLFSSLDKFDSRTGWPSFSRPIDESRVVARSDRAHGMLRTEVRSKIGDSHLGHVFDDGPRPTGQRYCINSAALRFIPKDQLAEAGYGEFLARFSGAAAPTAQAQPSNACADASESPGCAPTVETAILAGGCFWGMEEIIRAIPGVLATDVGYAGGRAGVKYEEVTSGRTGNAEAVRVVFDPKRLSYEDLLEHWFFRMHDPTTVDRQGNDEGSQYRSAIFVASAQQRAIAERVKARVNASGRWPRPLVTQIGEATAFTVAEDYHQDYLQKNPGGYTCHYLRDFPKPRGSRE